MLDYLIDSYHDMVSEIDLSHFRYLYHQFNLDSRLTGIVGSRGVGKTTLMLQYIKQHLYDGSEETFYVSADHLYFSEVTLLEFVHKMATNYDTKTFFIDEIHKYPNWNRELKNIYDSMPKIKIVFSGSSSLDLVHGSFDLSRRAVLFHLHGLSFREYLNFSSGSDYKTIDWDVLISKPMNLQKQLATIPKLKAQFNAYLEKGYYPFVFESESTLYQKLERVIKKTIYEDIALFYNLKTPNLINFEKMLHFLATIPPGKINTNNLAKHLKIDNKTVTAYLSMLQKTGLIRMVYADAIGNQMLRKPEKVFLNNVTLLSALNFYLGEQMQRGTARELFFLQMIENAGKIVNYTDKGDYEVAKTVFEIGGRNKTNKQVRGQENAWLVKDDIEYPSKLEIPLWYFGFLY